MIVAVLQNYIWDDMLYIHIQYNYIPIDNCYIMCCCSLAKLFPTLCDPREACQASLSSTISPNLPRFISIESVMLSNHLILCCSLLFLPSTFSSSRVFFNELALHIRWAKFQSSVVPTSIGTAKDWFPLKLTGLISLLSKVLLRVFSNTTVQKHQLFSALPSLQSSSHMHTWLLERP